MTERLRLLDKVIQRNLFFDNYSNELNNITVAKLFSDFTELNSMKFDDANLIPAYNNFDSHDLYKQYHKKSKLISKYQNIIKIYWKGEKKNIKQLFKHATSQIKFNSRFFYQLYYVIFKFYITAYYFEIQKFRIFKIKYK